jgi:16S rRNA (cytosine1402-N4)-methyltransferase
MLNQGHIPVLLDEVLKFIQPKADENFIDATLGGGGYTKAILERTAPNGRVMSFDLDDSAIVVAQTQLSDFFSRIVYIHENYSKLKTKINEYQFNKICGIVCDLGYSSLQIEDKTRGFSFESEGQLDLRYNIKTELTADEILHTWSEKNLVEILKNYGQEPLAYRIVKEILFIRKKTKITGQVLKEIVEKVYAKKWHTPSRIHPATRVWQALRIAVNDEFEHLRNFLPQAIEVMQKDGILAIVSFHSLEDKIVKEYFKTEARDCICPKEATICVCQHKARIKILTKKPVVPSQAEITRNPRSRSAKLRVVQKII